MTASRALLVRRLLASLASATLGAILIADIAAHLCHRPPGLESVLLATLAAVPVVSAALVWSPRIAAQLLARGAWWSLLLAGGLGALIDADRRFSIMVVCNAIALLAAGRSGLTDGAGRFQPVAFRGTLVLALVLAIADTGAFLWTGYALAVREHQFSLILLAVPMAIGIVGLLRMRTWGLFLGVACNLTVAVLAVTRVLGLPDILRLLFLGTACLQLLIPLPMFVSIVRRRRPDPDGWRRTKAVLVTSVIGGIVTLALYATFFRHGRALVRF